MSIYISYYIMQFSICNHIYIVWLNHYTTFKVRSVGGVEKWEDGKYLVFHRVYLVGGIEKQENGKLFYLVEKKSGMIENVVYIN